MKKRILFAAAALLCILALAACDALPGGTPGPGPTGGPDVNITPGVSATPMISEDGTFALAQNTVYFPEGASASDAKFVLTYILPSFLTQDAFAAGANASVELFLAELQDRVREEYLEAAQQKEGQSSLVVTASVDTARGYTNVFLYSVLTLGDTQEEQFSTLVFNDQGQEAGLAAVADVYDVNALAQLVLNRMAQERDKYFGELALEDIAQRMDLYNGYYVTDEGYALYFAPGSIAAAVEGPIYLEFSSDELYPAFVREVMEPDAYALLLPAFTRLANVAAVEFESFDGAPSPRIASLYLAYAVNDGAGGDAVARDGDTLSLNDSDLLVIYEEVFAGEFPGLDEQVTSIVLEGDVCQVERMQPPAAYRLSFSEAQAGEGSVTLIGRILFLSESNLASDVAGVTIELAADPAVPAGYRISAFLIL